MATIMIVDDAKFMRFTLRNMIEGSGHQVIAEAQNGKEAIQMYHMYRPDLILMDITMPEMDGITAVKELMKINSKVKIIMCSAMGQHKMVMDAIHAGAKDFVVKPVNPERVLEAIINVLQQEKR